MSEFEEFYGNLSVTFYFQIVNHLYKLGWLTSGELEKFITQSEGDSKGQMQVRLTVFLVLLREDQLSDRTIFNIICIHSLISAQ